MWDSLLMLILLHRDYPTDANDYKMLEECGRGVSATVSNNPCNLTLYRFCGSCFLCVVEPYSNFSMCD